MFRSYALEQSGLTKSQPRPTRDETRRELCEGIDHEHFAVSEFEARVWEWLNATYPLVSAADLAKYRRFYPHSVSGGTYRSFRESAVAPGDVVEELGKAKLTTDSQDGDFDIVEIVILRRQVDGADEYIGFAHTKLNAIKDGDYFLVGQWTGKEAQVPSSIEAINAWIEEEDEKQKLHVEEQEAKIREDDERRRKEERLMDIISWVIGLTVVSLIIGGIAFLTHDERKQITICSVESSDPDGAYPYYADHFIKSTGGAIYVIDAQPNISPSEAYYRQDAQAYVPHDASDLPAGAVIRVDVYGRDVLHPTHKRVHKKVTLLSLNGNTKNC